MRWILFIPRHPFKLPFHSEHAIVPFGALYPHLLPPAAALTSLLTSDAFKHALL
jgi:hypothetical protein